MTAEITKTFTISNNDDALIFGINDANLKIIAEKLNLKIHPFGERVDLTGEPSQVQLATQILTILVKLLHSGIQIGESDVVSATQMALEGQLEYFADLYNQVILHNAQGHAIRVRNLGQRQYLQTIKKHDITFGIGPAGTGKTYLAVVMAVAALKKGQVRRLVLTRPAVEAGENLGFLPGDLKEKVDPYLRPIYDALYDILGTEHTNHLLERGVIEIAPLAYMRGRTLDEAFVILDEAQNTTREQMKMFLTRLGFGSKMVVNGDATQIDLPRHAKSGLIEAAQILRNLPRIGFVDFKTSDVVRHPVVAEIIAAYQQKTGSN
ncbi:PhoH family protein [Bombilactobacillus mellifer]|uniref:PhoH-like protein n=1 Tax=Bombilactobacillus mellifer TaxID=1218492 RepID=A0A0F4LTX0_9LACO|nr:PhoH family protein [Bombilactobacillus mellifer]MBH9990779.1 PhoH family protein [Lactobacillus sp. W8092]KJY61744.1 PhoH family protein [Bombilactobacillus mellifer]MCT6825764.1 PhoH family protein [Bombilactobacillus mellifer]MCT6843189.1 PhoH family protein [Bombilactobacillus mellifer]MCT6894487.1 PhoH family protein [Bombilactobacillus mellifer]